MNVLGAMEDTVCLAESRVLPAEGPASAAHLRSMLDRMTPGQSEGKRNRWLGYAQGVLVALSAATLDEVKDINKRHAG